MFYVHWQGCVGHAQEFEWLPASCMESLSSIDTKLVGASITVFWVRKLGDKEAIYHGTLEDVDDEDLGEIAAAAQLSENNNKARVFKIGYEDCSAELINLETFETASATCDACKEFFQSRHKRSKWVLKEFWQPDMCCVLREG